MIAIMAIAAAPMHAAAVPGSAASAQEPATVERIDALRNGMTRSSDLRLRIAFSYRYESIDDAQPEKGVRTIERLSSASLAESSRGSTDPLLLDLLFARCSMGNPAETKTCDRLDIARRWILADTQNQRAWLALASYEREMGDELGARASFIRAAQASRWHESEWDVARLMAAAMPNDLTNVERLRWLEMSFAQAFLITTTVHGVMLDYCKQGGELARACLRITETASRDADTLMTLHLAASFAARAQAPDPLVRAYRVRGDAISWAVLEANRNVPEWMAQLDEVAATEAIRKFEPLLRTARQSCSPRGEHR